MIKEFGYALGVRRGDQRGGYVSGAKALAHLAQVAYSSMGN